MRRHSGISSRATHPSRSTRSQPGERTDTVASVLGELPESERQVIEMRYGLSDGIEKSRDAIAKELGLSWQRVDKLETEALERLQREGRLEALREAA